MQRMSVVVLLTVALAAGCGPSLARAARSKTASDPAAALLAEAKQQYLTLVKEPSKERVSWLDCLATLRQVLEKYPQSAAAGEARFTEASVYRDLFRRQGKSEDLQQAIAAFQEMAKADPRHPLAAKALLEAAELWRGEKKDAVSAAFLYQKIIDNYPESEPARPARAALAQLNGGATAKKAAASGSATLERIRYWSNPDYTRVVIYLDRPIAFGQPQRLKNDAKHNRPDRIYLDLENTKLSAEAARPLRIGDGQLRQVRAGQFTAKKTRVVMEIERIDDFQLVAWNDPFRLILDIQGKARAAAVAGGEEKLRREIDGEVQKILARPQAGIRRIALDPGHGGSDPGAIGPAGLVEKEVTLEIARQLAQELKRRGFDVFLTRDTDLTLPLEERTALANEKKADLFISIHTNASPKRHAGGVSTFVFNNSDDEESLRLAAMENNARGGAASNSGSYLQLTLASLRKDQQTGQSRELAGRVQEALVNQLKRKYEDVANLGIREAYFYVLLGAQMPCILIETSFISNPDEEKRLRSARYRGAIAEGIARGVERFVKGAAAGPRQARLGP